MYYLTTQVQQDASQVLQADNPTTMDEAIKALRTSYGHKSKQKSKLLMRNCKKLSETYQALYDDIKRLAVLVHTKWNEKADEDATEAFINAVTDDRIKVDLLKAEGNFEETLMLNLRFETVYEAVKNSTPPTYESFGQ